MAMQLELKETQQQLKRKDEKIHQLNLSVDKLDRQLTQCVAQNKILNEKVDALEEESEKNFKWCFNSITASVNLLGRLSVIDKNTRIMPHNNNFGTILPLLNEHKYEVHIVDKMPCVNVLKAIVYKNEKYSFNEFKKCFIENFKYSFKERAEYLLECMETGKTYQNGKHELYFKLPLKQWKSIIIELHDNITPVINQVKQGKYSGVKMVFASEDFFLVRRIDEEIGGYHKLWIQKKEFDRANTSIYLFPIENGDEKLPLKLCEENTVNCQYKNQNEEVLFQIQIN